MTLGPRHLFVVLAALCAFLALVGVASHVPLLAIGLLLLCIGVGL